MQLNEEARRKAEAEEAKRKEEEERKAQEAQEEANLVVLTMFPIVQHLYGS